MRKLAVAVVVIGVLGGVLLVAVASWANRLIAGQRDRILDSAQTALGRPIAVDGITASLWGGIGVRLTDVRIADDPRFGATDFVRAAAVTVRAKLWPLLHGEVEIGRVDLQQPEISLIRDPSGRWNCAGLTALHNQPRPRTSSAVPALAPTAAYASAAPAPPTSVPFSISRAGIDDGTVVLIDQTQNPARTTRVTAVDLTLTDLSTTTPIRFDLDLAVQRDVPNVHLYGTVGPLGSGDQVPVAVGGRLGPVGAMDVRVDTLQIAGVVQRDRISISQASGRVFDGAFAFTGDYPLTSDGTAALKATLSDINIAKLPKVDVPNAPSRIAGTARVRVDVRSPGASLSTLSGEVTADVDDGAIRDFNLVNEVLGRVSGLPGIGALISTNVKPKYARLFGATETRFETFHGTFQLNGDQRIRTDDLAIVATDYGVRAGGWIGFDREADLTGTLLMSSRFSEDVAADIKEAKYLLDDSGQLAVPFRLRGTLGAAKPTPDSDRLIALLTRALSRGAAKDLLNRFLGGQRSDQPTAGGNKPSSPIERELRELFGR